MRITERMSRKDRGRLQSEAHQGLPSPTRNEEATKKDSTQSLRGSTALPTP